MDETFTGCKLAYIYNDKLLVYRRDNNPAIPFPNQWDFPGGGREGDESPEDCVLRELQEEFGLVLPASRLVYRQQVVNHLQNGLSFFFVALGNEDEINAIRFGDEGQFWQLMDTATFLADPDAMLILKIRLLGLLYSYHG
jgi:8-oxo-dGTP diphosphatase